MLKVTYDRMKGVTVADGEVRAFAKGIVERHNRGERDRPKGYEFAITVSNFTIVHAILGLVTEEKISHEKVQIIAVTKTGGKLTYTPDEDGEITDFKLDPDGVSIEVDGCDDYATITAATLG